MNMLLKQNFCDLDQSSAGAIRRCKFHLTEEADDLLRGRFRIINCFSPSIQIFDKDIC